MSHFLEERSLTQSRHDKDEGGFGWSRPFQVEVLQDFGAVVSGHWQDQLEQRVASI